MKPNAYRRVCLETSLKPFTKLDPASIVATCNRLWSNWDRLVERVDEILILLWVGDGSEVLQWQGDLKASLPHADSIGFCNYDMPGAFPPENRHYRINRAVPYLDSPPDLTFGHLKQIITTLRQTACDCWGREILVGATIDPGPEFVHNDWKFSKHPEVLIPDMRERMPQMMHFITHQATIQPDGEVYAGFPQGLTEPTSFGTFLGRQFAAARRDLDYDYFWFSNGFGYTHFPWTHHGEVFDGHRFNPEKAAVERELAARFWSDFRQEEPEAEIQVRGTNFTVGMDIAANGVSHTDIARIGKLERPPCNPPWGSRALGLEMVSFLSRICKTPGRDIIFRFYLNDPWFVSSPWYDYYNRETFDIYVPMAAARLTSSGSVEAPTDLSLLTIDTEKGELLRDQSTEVIPHLLRAATTRPDAVGPVVWVYPYDEYHGILENQPERLPEIFAHDWFACQMTNAGLPLNTVCDTSVFAGLADRDLLPDAILVAPVPDRNSGWGDALLAHARGGGRVLLYGPLDQASPELLQALEVELADPLEGDFAVDCRLETDRFCRPPVAPTDDAFMASVGMQSEPGFSDTTDVRLLRHRALTSGGGLRAVATEDQGIRCQAIQHGHTRTYALLRDVDSSDGGKIAWIQGTVSFDPSTRSGEPVLDPPWQFLRPDDWPRHLLAELGLAIRQDRDSETTKPANVFVKRHDGAWFFTGHKPDTSVRFQIRTADGAPCYMEAETPILDGYGGETFSKTFHHEVRAFVRMADGTVRSKAMPVPVGRQQHFSLEGLVHADVTLYPSPAAVRDGSVDLKPIIAGDTPVPCQTDLKRGTLHVSNFTGTLYVCW